MAPEEVELVMRRHQKGLVAAVEGATADAGVGIADVDYVVGAFTTRRQLAQRILDPLGIDIERTTWEFGRRTGHMGNSDIFAGLNYLAESGRLAEGQKILLIGEGGGYVCTTAVLEVINCPSWGAVLPATME
jgi:3-oxoacyl-[acyl-carrier-protein] synthase III